MERYMCLLDIVHNMWRTGGDSTEVGMEFTDPNTQRGQQHMDHRDAKDPVEGGGGSARHLSTRKPPVT